MVLLLPPLRVVEKVELLGDKAIDNSKLPFDEDKIVLLFPSYNRLRRACSPPSTGRIQVEKLKLGGSIRGLS